MTANPATAAADLVAHYRRQRPVRGGSLIVTLFGDSIMPRGGAVALGSLIGLAAAFGLKERLVRTAVSRLVKEGWLRSRRSGKLSEYHLSHDGQERFADATGRIYGEPAGEWSGRWTVAVLPPMRAAARTELRKELLWKGFGELSSNVFAHPEIDLRSAGFPPGVIVFDAGLSGDDSSRALVDLGWDLEELGLRYQRFVERFRRVLTALRDTRARALEPRGCFIVRTLLIHEYRRLHLRDPLLPARLLPADWPGTRAAALCRDIYGRVFDPSEQFLSQTAARLDGPLPAPEAAVLGRFGGISRVLGGPLLERADD